MDTETTINVIRHLETELEKTKCCGSCKWCNTDSNYCENPNSPMVDSPVYINQKCPGWEVRAF